MLKSRELCEQEYLIGVANILKSHIWNRIMHSLILAEWLEKLIYLHYENWVKKANPVFNNCIVKKVIYPQEYKEIPDFNLWEVELEDKLTKKRLKVYLVDVLWYEITQDIFSNFPELS